jgi:hypothetical protein
MCGDAGVDVLSRCCPPEKVAKQKGKFTLVGSAQGLTAYLPEMILQDISRDSARREF